MRVEECKERSASREKEGAEKECELRSASRGE